MQFRTLQENLRKLLCARIAARELTGVSLAARAGFRQGHISNFLNRKRGLSVAAMDRVLGVQRLSVLDLLDPAEIDNRASIVPPGDDEFENVVLVDCPAAARPRITRRSVKEVLKIRKSFLSKLHPEMEGKRSDWQRFVFIRLDAREGMSVYPRAVPGAVLLIDRHYNSLKPYRKSERNLYAVCNNGYCTVKYVDVVGNQLVLRPHNSAYPVSALLPPRGRKLTDYIIGRVCSIAIET